MNILNNLSDTNTIQANTPVQKVEEKNVAQTPEYKPDLLDIASKKVIDSRDITDTVTMPRAIFKGYMCFTAGTTLNAISAMLKKNAFSKGLAIGGSLLAILGTFNFVKPFLIREQDLTKSEK